MKTDKELLILAAKAAGINYKNGFQIVEERGIFLCWNPLTDDGDAFRLATALSMSITHFTPCVHVRPFYEEMSGYIESEPVPTTGDRLQATRRAIVKAAAAIGERL